MNYFLVRNVRGESSPDYYHYFIVRSKWPSVPSDVTHRGFQVIASVNTEEGLKSVQNLYMNSHMRQWVECWGKWPVIDGWN